MNQCSLVMRSKQGELGFKTRGVWDLHVLSVMDCCSSSPIGPSLGSRMGYTRQ